LVRVVVESGLSHAAVQHDVKDAHQGGPAGKSVSLLHDRHWLNGMGHDREALPDRPTRTYGLELHLFRRGNSGKSTKQNGRSPGALNAAGASNLPRISGGWEICATIES
jgi:hypothetical protein